VKLVLFKIFCLCLYDVALWTYCSVTVNLNLHTINVLKYFCFARRDSISGILMDLSLPSADAVVHNFRVLCANQCVMSSNKMVQCFNAVKVI